MLKYKVARLFSLIYFALSILSFDSLLAAGNLSYQEFSQNSNITLCPQDSPYEYAGADYSSIKKALKTKQLDLGTLFFLTLDLPDDPDDFSVSSLGRLTRRLDFTLDDMLWLARSLKGEGGYFDPKAIEAPEDVRKSRKANEHYRYWFSEELESLNERERNQVIAQARKISLEHGTLISYAYATNIANKAIRGGYNVTKYINSPSFNFTKFIQSYSQPINLKDFGRNGLECKKLKRRAQRAGNLKRRQEILFPCRKEVVERRHRLAKTQWCQLPVSAREVAFNFVMGQLPHLAPSITDFAAFRPDRRRFDELLSCPHHRSYNRFAQHKLTRHFVGREIRIVAGGVVNPLTPENTICQTDVSFDRESQVDDVVASLENWLSIEKREQLRNSKHMREIFQSRIDFLQEMAQEQYSRKTRAFLSEYRVSIEELLALRLVENTDQI